MHNVLHTIRHTRLEQLLWYAEVAVFVVALGFYVYCIVMSVVHVVLRQEYMVLLADTQAKISKLEATYLERSSALTEASAHDIGLITTAPRAYLAIEPPLEHISRRP